MRRIILAIGRLGAVAILLLPLPAAAQPAPAPGSAATQGSRAPTLSAQSYTPITTGERIQWTVDGTIGGRSLAVGVLDDAWMTAWNVPEEWGRGWSGIGKRYMQREADVSISNSMEAGLGALWGEDPRYIASGRAGLWPRARYAMKTVFLAQRRDGHLAPAWGRYAANTFNNIIENAWLPPSQTTWQTTAWRSASGFLGRMAGNLWDEFWPDARRRWFERPRGD